MRIKVNIFAMIDQDVLDIIAGYDCYLLDVVRNADGTIGPHVTGTLEGNEEDIQVVLEELDVVMNSSR